MATEFDRQISPLEMERLQTSIKYHDWFLGFVVVVGVSLSIYLVDSMNTLQEGLADVRTRIEVMQKDVEVMQKDIEVVKRDIEVMKQDIDTLEMKFDRMASKDGQVSQQRQSRNFP